MMIEFLNNQKQKCVMNIYVHYNFIRARSICSKSCFFYFIATLGTKGIAMKDTRLR